MNYYVHAYEPGYGWTRSMGAYDINRAMHLAGCYKQMGMLNVRLTPREKIA